MSPTTMESVNVTETEKPEVKKIITPGEKTKDTRFVHLDLPSKCIAYTGIQPEDIKIRMLIGSDVELLKNIYADNYYKSLIELLQGIVKGIDVKILTPGDIQCILLWEAIHSYSNIVPYTFTCESCKEGNTQIDLSNYKIVTLSDDYCKKTEIKLSTGKTIKLRLLTVEDEMIVLNVERTRGNEKTEYLLYLARGIIGDISESVKLLQGMSAKDLLLIERWHKKWKHGIADEMKQKCKCKKISTLVIPLDLLLIFPEVFGD